MQHRRRAVKGLTKAVTGKVSHHGKSVTFGKLLDGMANIAEGVAGPGRVDAGHQAVIGDFGQAPRLHRRFAHIIHPRSVAIPAIQNDRDIDVQNVAVADCLLARNAVADNMVKRNAGGLRESLVIQRCRYGAMGLDEVVANPVKVTGGRASHNMRGDHVKHTGGKPAGSPHSGKTALIMNNHRFGAHVACLLPSCPDAHSSIAKPLPCQALAVLGAGNLAMQRCFHRHAT